MKFQIKTLYVIDAETNQEALNAWAKEPLARVVSMTMDELTVPDKEQPKTFAQKVVATTTALAKDAAVQAGIAEKTPMCPDHQVAMQKKPSKFGQGKFYFACPVKLDDGKYCRAKPL